MKCLGCISPGCEGTDLVIVDPLSAFDMAMKQFNALRTQEEDSLTCYFAHHEHFRMTHPSFHQCEIIGQESICFPKLLEQRHRKFKYSDDLLNITVCASCGYNLKKTMERAAKTEDAHCVGQFTPIIKRSIR